MNDFKQSVQKMAVDVAANIAGVVEEFNRIMEQLKEIL